MDRTNWELCSRRGIEHAGKYDWGKVGDKWEDLLRSEVEAYEVMTREVDAERKMVWTRRGGQRSGQ